jgi:hypothetical protein
MFRYDGLTEKGTGVKPGSGPCRRNARGWVFVDRLGKIAGSGGRGEFLSVPLIDPAKTAKLAPPRRSSRGDMSSM